MEDQQTIVSVRSVTRVANLSLPSKFTHGVDVRMIERRYCALVERYCLDKREDLSRYFVLGFHLSDSGLLMKEYNYRSHESTPTDENIYFEATKDYRVKTIQEDGLVILETPICHINSIQLLKVTQDEVVLAINGIQSYMVKDIKLAAKMMYTYKNLVWNVE